MLAAFRFFEIGLAAYHHSTFALLVCLALSGNVARAANILVNPGFEADGNHGSGTQPEGWTGVPGGPWYINSDQYAHSGNNYYKVWGAFDVPPIFNHFTRIIVLCRLPVIKRMAGCSPCLPTLCGAETASITHGCKFRSWMTVTTYSAFIPIRLDSAKPTIRPASGMTFQSPIFVKPCLPTQLLVLPTCWWHLPELSKCVSSITCINFSVGEVLVILMTQPLTRSVGRFRPRLHRSIRATCCLPATISASISIRRAVRRSALTTFIWSCNGTDVSTNCTFTGATPNIGVIYSGIATNVWAYTASITVTDAYNFTASQTINFDTINPTYVWESEDYDFTNGGIYQ